MFKLTSKMLLPLGGAPRSNATRVIGWNTLLEVLRPNKIT